MDEVAWMVSLAPAFCSSMAAMMVSMSSEDLVMPSDIPAKDSPAEEMDATP